MPAAARPRRSVLYMPGSNARALEKGKSLPADGLILDLEDAVAPDAKAMARGQIAEAVRQGGYGGREILVRVNAPETEWGNDDIIAIATCGADAILLPKVENAATVQRIDEWMRDLGAPDTMALWCMIETPLGVLNVSEIAGATQRLGGFVMGTSDLAKDLHASHTPMRLPMLTALGLCMLAGRAHGLAMIDGVHLDLEDEAGFADSCRQGLELGFDGRSLIHPKQIARANEVFAPGAGEIDNARRIIDAHRAAVAEGKGVVVVDGRLVENLHVENALRIVALANAIDELESQAGG
ncbi:MAG: CoA ester lyase [Inquilinus sp.]|nr:CoA ester lyase [Inquilinus sp.]